MSHTNTASLKDTLAKDGDILGPALLILPAELREKIYKLLLTEDEEIIVTAALNEPALLSVNHQIRREARNIWYGGNLFVVRITACDDTLLSNFVKHCDNIEVPRLIKMRCCPMEKSWANLEKWGENLFNCESIGYMEDAMDSDVKEFVVPAAAHSIVFQHMENGRTWLECEAALEVLKKVVQSLDPAWM